MQYYHMNAVYQKHVHSMFSFFVFTLLIICSVFILNLMAPTICMFMYHCRIFLFCFALFVLLVLFVLFCFVFVFVCFILLLLYVVFYIVFVYFNFTTIDCFIRKSIIQSVFFTNISKLHTLI